MGWRILQKLFIVETHATFPRMYATTTTYTETWPQALVGLNVRLCLMTWRNGHTTQQQLGKQWRNWRTLWDERITQSDHTEFILWLLALVPECFGWNHYEERLHVGSRHVMIADTNLVVSWSQVQILNKTGMHYVRQDIIKIISIYLYEYLSE